MLNGTENGWLLFSPPGGTVIVVRMLTLNLLNEDACQTIHMLICCSFIPGEFHLFPTSLYTTLHAYFFIHLKYSVFILYHSIL